MMVWPNFSEKRGQSSQPPMEIQKNVKSCYNFTCKIKKIQSIGVVPLRFKFFLLQNVLLAFGIICIYKFISLKDYYGYIKEWKEKRFPIIDGDGVGLTFLGVSLHEDGFHWTEIMSVANAFLVVGMVFVGLAIGLLVWKARTMKS